MVCVSPDGTARYSWELAFGSLGGIRVTRCGCGVGVGLIFVTSGGVWVLPLWPGVVQRSCRGEEGIAELFQRWEFKAWRADAVLRGMEQWNSGLPAPWIPFISR